MFYYIDVFVQGARLKTLPAVVVPVVMATALAFYNEHSFDLKIFILTLVSGVFLQIAANFFNDALDFKFGGDTHLRKGPPRVAQTRKLSVKSTFIFGFFCAAIAFLTGLFLVLIGGWPVLVFGLIALTLSYFYSGHSFSLVKNGLAELVVFLFFGWFAVGFTYYLQTLKWDDSVIYLGIQCGLWALSLLLVNYLRDEEEDNLMSRKHLITTHGRAAGLLAFVIFQAFIYLLCFYWLSFDIKGGAFSFFLIIPSILLTYFICTTPPSKKYNLFLSLTSLLYILFGVFWVLGVLF